VPRHGIKRSFFSKAANAATAFSPLRSCGHAIKRRTKSADAATASLGQVSTLQPQRKVDKQTFLPINSHLVAFSKCRLMPYRWHSCFYYPPTQGSTMFAALHIVPHLGYRNVIPSGFKFHPRAFNVGADAVKLIENADRFNP
jgi:hypothetical protein